MEYMKKMLCLLALQSGIAPGILSVKGSRPTLRRLEHGEQGRIAGTLL